MKKRYLASLLPFALVLPMLFVQNNTKQVEAATPTYNIPLEAGEELDYENEIYDGFGNGIVCTAVGG